MQAYQAEFIEFCLRYEALRFGEFVLKSKRVSPYFFNAGQLCDGQAYLHLARFYAATIQAHFQTTEYDILFGPAYKGISLATAASIGLAQQGLNVPVCFNRKEVKDHGEGGVMMGASLKNKRALLIDDVITAGTTIREAQAIAVREGGTLAGAVIALDRQEKRLETPLKVAAIISFQELIAYLKTVPQLNRHLEALLAYQTQWGST